jgi:hypothetical protein
MPLGTSQKKIIILLSEAWRNFGIGRHFTDRICQPPVAFHVVA